MTRRDRAWRVIALAVACAVVGFAVLPACVFAPLGPSRLRKTPPQVQPPPTQQPPDVAPVQSGEIRLVPAAPAPVPPTKPTP